MEEPKYAVGVLGSCFILVRFSLRFEEFIKTLFAFINAILGRNLVVGPFSFIFLIFL